MYTTNYIQEDVINRFLECVDEFQFFQKFEEEVYLWSNFPYNFTHDIDLIFIGKPTESLAKRIIDFKIFANKKGCMKIDEQVFENTKIFSYIPDMNKGNAVFNDITKYKLSDTSGNHRSSEKINKYFWKHDLTKPHMKNSERRLHYPILLQDFAQLVFNITNQDVYNTLQDKTMEAMIELKTTYRNRL